MRREHDGPCEREGAVGIMLATIKKFKVMFMESTGAVRVRATSDPDPHLKIWSLAGARVWRGDPVKGNLIGHIGTWAEIGQWADAEGR